MQKDKKSTVEAALNCLKKTKVNYCLGNESLDGINKGDLFRYGAEIGLYVFNFSLIKRIKMRFLLFSKGLFIRWQFKNNRYKIKRKIFNKISNFYYKDNKPIYLYPAKKTKKSYTFKIRNKKLYYDIEDLDFKNFDKIKYDDWEFPIPEKITQFIDKYYDNIFAGRYNIYDVTINNEDEKKIINFLSNVVSIIKDLNIKYWLEGGTCLGAVRDGKLIPWDHDLDLGIEFANQESIDKLIKTLKKRYHIKIREFPNMDEVWNLGKYRLIKVYPKKNIIFNEKLCLDIFLFYREPLSDKKSDIVFKYVVFNKNGYHPSKYLETLKTINFYEKEFNIPNKTEQWLESKYGKDWEIPKRSWHVLIDDGTIIR